MKMKRILSLTLICTMLFCIPVTAGEPEDIDVSDSKEISAESADIYEMETISLDDEQINELLSKKNDIQPYSTVPDACEPNDTRETAYPYDKVETLTPRLTNTIQLYTLGMKHAGLHSETDEDWYSIYLTAGQKYFVDIRNTGSRNWFIELRYYSDTKSYYYTTNPDERPVYTGKPEKYFYFTAKDTGTYYIRICNANMWSDEMDYFFYVGPEYQVFNIVDMPANGTTLAGYSYRTCTFDLRNAVPADTEILDLSVTDTFPQGKPCSEVDKYLSAGGKTYYSKSGSDTINNIEGASLGQLWTLGAKCSKGLHTTYWSGRLDGRVRCRMAPYPGNELPL